MHSLEILLMKLMKQVHVVDQGATSSNPLSDAKQSALQVPDQSQDHISPASPATPNHADSCRDEGGDNDHCETSGKACDESCEGPKTLIPAFAVHQPHPFLEVGDDYGGPEPCYSDASNGNSTGIDSITMCMSTSQAEDNHQPQSVECISKIAPTFNVDGSEESPILNCTMDTPPAKDSRRKKRPRPYSVTNIEEHGTTINCFSCSMEADEPTEDIEFNVLRETVDGPNTPQVTASNVTSDSPGTWEQAQAVHQGSHGDYSYKEQKRLKLTFENSPDKAPLEFTCVRSSPWWKYPSKARNRKESISSWHHKYDQVLFQ